MDRRQKLEFWKGVLNVVDPGMDDYLFLTSCEICKEQLLLNDRMFMEYYVTYFDGLEDIPDVIKLRFNSSFAWAG